MSSYQYNTVETASGSVDLTLLESEIRGETLIVTGLSSKGIVLSSTSFEIHFKQELSPGEVTALESLVAAHEGVLKDVQTSGQLAATSQPSLTVSIYPPKANRFNLVSHRWTDPTTWYTHAVYVVGEILTPEAGLQVFNASNPNLIDLTHGKHFKEDDLVSPEGTSYQPRVYVDGVLQVEQHPNYPVMQDPEMLGDYVIDYAAGAVTFHEALNSGQAVTIDYYYATDSAFYIEPEQGKLIDLSRVEVQFTQDVSITDTVEFVLEGYAGVFAPDAVTAGTLAATDRVELGIPATYKTFYDYCNEANGAYPLIPKTSNLNPSWRDAESPILTFPWDYQAVVTLRSDQGMRIKVRLKNDWPFSGSFSTATFYGFTANI